MDESVKHLFLVAQDQSRKYASNYKREQLKIANGFKLLASAFEISGQEEKNLLSAIKGTCATYETIAKFYEEQPAQDFEPLSDVLHEYKGKRRTINMIGNRLSATERLAAAACWPTMKSIAKLFLSSLRTGIMSSWPEILEIHKGALNRKKEHIKLKEDGKIDVNTCESVSSRADQISYACLAEMNHFQSERVNDFKGVITSFLKEQINFHEKLVGQLKEALQKYEYVN